MADLLLGLGIGLFTAVAVSDMDYSYERRQRYLREEENLNRAYYDMLETQRRYNEALEEEERYRKEEEAKIETAMRQMWDRGETSIVLTNEEFGIIEDGLVERALEYRLSGKHIPKHIIDKYDQIIDDRVIPILGKKCGREMAHLGSDVCPSINMPDSLDKNERAQLHELAIQERDRIVQKREKILREERELEERRLLRKKQEKEWGKLRVAASAVEKLKGKPDNKKRWFVAILIIVIILIIGAVVTTVVVLNNKRKNDRRPLTETDEPPPY